MLVIFFSASFDLADFLVSNKQYKLLIATGHWSSSIVIACTPYCPTAVRTVRRYIGKACSIIDLGVKIHFSDTVCMIDLMKLYLRTIMIQYEILPDSASSPQHSCYPFYSSKSV